MRKGGKPTKKDTLAMKKFYERKAGIDENLQELERLALVDSRWAIYECSCFEDEIDKEIELLEQSALDIGFYPFVARTLISLRLRKEALADKPRIEIISLTEAIDSFNPVALCVEDRFNEEKRQSELSWLTVTDTSLKALVDTNFIPSDNRSPLQGVIDQEEAAYRVWNQLLDSIQGRYILTEDFELLQTQLAITAKRHGLKIPMLVGQSIFDLCARYLRLDPVGPWQIPLGEEYALNSAGLREEVKNAFLEQAPEKARLRATCIIRAFHALKEGKFVFEEMWNADGDQRTRKEV